MAVGMTTLISAASCLVSPFSQTSWPFSLVTVLLSLSAAMTGADKAHIMASASCQSECFFHVYSPLRSYGYLLHPGRRPCVYSRQPSSATEPLLKGLVLHGEHKARLHLAQIGFAVRPVGEMRAVQL